MIGQRSVVLVLLLCFIAGTDSKSVKHEPVCKGTNQLLMNTAITIGFPSSFSNQLDPIGVKWEIVPSNKDDSYTIADNNTVQPPFVGSYAVNSTHLDIPMVDASTAGLYTVTYKTGGCQSMANLIGVYFEPACGCSKTDWGNAVLTCEIRYAVADTYPNEANLIWTSDSGKAYSGRQKISKSSRNSAYTAVSNHRIKSSDAANFTCVVTFSAPEPSGPANMATNAPPFNTSCTIENCVKNETVIEEKGGISFRRRFYHRRFVRI